MDHPPISPISQIAKRCFLIEIPPLQVVE